MSLSKEISDVEPFLHDYDGSLRRISEHDAFRSTNAVQLLREVSSRKKPYSPLRLAIGVLVVISYTFLVALLTAKIVENRSVHSFRCKTSSKHRDESVC